MQCSVPRSPSVTDDCPPRASTSPGFLAEYTFENCQPMSRPGLVVRNGNSGLVGSHLLEGNFAGVRDWISTSRPLHVKVPGVATPAAITKPLATYGG